MDAVIRGMVHRVGQQFIQISPHVIISTRNRNAYAISIAFARYAMGLNYQPGDASAAIEWARETEAWADFCNNDGLNLCGQGLANDWFQRRQQAWKAVHPLSGHFNPGIAILGMSCAADRFCGAYALGANTGASALQQILDRKAEAIAGLSIVGDAAQAGAGDAFGGLSAVQSDTGAAVAARLDVNGGSFIGTNLARGNAPIKGTMSFFVQRAEGDAFAQALRAGDLSGQFATLYVTRAPCGFCVSSLSAVARSSGLSELTVITPDGVFATYTPEAGWVRP